ncbi:hypothetical protein GCM10009785_16000 [Brooklawnia cerclae]|uniref:Nucleotide-binding protein (Sugar kinase/HSP70/actin superfamily) n=1 Tax=Brooklawnia cerclae TaxID=349934 RepID=A0ABX0SM45_9ACTN|nr:2-hydroxyacyl-CoA dehydratase [Brooklawnia cerclae]NIH57831.1 putative nucleotide-binding protein (sugar kinase/HSP70/actin superfamily) [Brooklawnia cerclae]
MSATRTTQVGASPHLARRTVIIPSTAPVRQHGLLDVALAAEGYDVEILPADDRRALDVGTRYVNNDYCHPPIDYVGQIVEALASGRYDLRHTAIMMSDPGTACSCRGGNFMTVMRKAIVDAGFGQVPVISQPFDFKDYTTQAVPGTLPLTAGLLVRLALASTYGDLFEKVVYPTRPYEQEPGSTDRLHAQWLSRVASNIRDASFDRFRVNARAIVRDFDALPRVEVVKPRIGIVGDPQLVINFTPRSPNIVRLLEEEGAEAVVPGMGFMSTYNILDMGHGHDRALGIDAQALGHEYHDTCEKPLDDALRASEHFTPFSSIFDMVDTADELAPFAHSFGHFFFMTGGKLRELLKQGVTSIVLFQAFNCAVNYVVGAGMVKKLKLMYPAADVLSVDYDPGMSMTNQINRIRLLIAAQERARDKADQDARVAS